MSRRAPGSFDPDDKYAKANSQNGNRSHATPPPNKSRPISDPHRFASQVASPAQAQGTDNNDIAARVRSKLDAAAASLNDDQPSGSDLVKGSLDRLAFASTVNNVASAFGSVGNDALDEVGTLASKATEQVALFHASQYAAKWMPVDSKLGMKPTYVKVHVQSAERIKFWENAELEQIVANHLEEKNAILAENAGLRSMLGLTEKASENVQEIRETEDGVNRALLMSAVEEIKRLRARSTVLESEAARGRMKESGFFGFGGSDGSGGGVDAAQMRKLTTEMARLEENNGRQRWMIGEKDKQIKETQVKFSLSEAYALRERLQECTEALQVAGNLQAEQLQYLEDNALAKLLRLDDQIADVQDDLDVRAEQLSQLRKVMKKFMESGNEKYLPAILSLAGFRKEEQQQVRIAHTQRESKTLGGLVSGLGRFGVKLGGGAVERLLKACAPPPMGVPKEGDAIIGVAVSTKDGTGGADVLKIAPSHSPLTTPTKTDGNSSDDPEAAASTAPPTLEKMELEPSSSNVSSAATTPVKRLEGNFEESVEVTENPEGPESNPGQTIPQDGALPSPPVAGETTARVETTAIVGTSGETASAATSNNPTNNPRPTRRNENETSDEKQARETSKAERRAKASASSSSGSSGMSHSHTSGKRGKADDNVFTGFEDAASVEREKRERAAQRPALPQPKLLGNAALREELAKKEDAARKAASGGFAGFGGDDDSDSD